MGTFYCVVFIYKEECHLSHIQANEYSRICLIKDTKKLAEDVPGDFSEWQMFMGVKTGNEGNSREIKTDYDL